MPVLVAAPAEHEHSPLVSQIQALLGAQDPPITREGRFTAFSAPAVDPETGKIIWRRALGMIDLGNGRAKLFGIPSPKYKHNVHLLVELLRRAAEDSRISRLVMDPADHLVTPMEFVVFQRRRGSEDLARIRGAIRNLLFSTTLIDLLADHLRSRDSKRIGPDRDRGDASEALGRVWQVLLEAIA